MKKKMISIAGARPQFVKAAAFHRALQKQSSHLLVHTGQHYDFNMSDIFFQQLSLPKPHYSLGINGCSHGSMTGKMLEKIEEVLLKERPNWVVVYGDTNSTLAGALAAVKLHIPVAHIESGLRSFNRKMPEEINRILTDQCSDLLFTSTHKASEQLIREGVSKEKICEVGDLIYDAVLYFQKKSLEGSDLLREFSLNPKEYILATLHRAENIENISRLREILEGLILVSHHTKVIFPMHPRTEKMLNTEGLYDHACKHLIVIKPVGYFEMIAFVHHAQCVMTDSGGLQKEAYFLKVPCITLRTETEWVELVDHGFNVLSPLTREDILETYKQNLNKLFQWGVQLYGNGQAGEAIVRELLTRQ